MPTNPATPSRAALRALRIAAEEDRAIIREAMSSLGRRSTPAKRRAARRNGKKGGRPKKG